MNCDISETVNGIKINKVDDFELKHIFECGQSFRWDEEADGSYTGVAKDRVVNVSKDNSGVYIDNTTRNDFDNIWYDYFDFGCDYGRIKSELSSDEILKKAVKFGKGIRILRQDEWETLVSFIISANNRIPMIKLAVKKISEKWGKSIRYNGTAYHTFPGPEVLKEASIGELESCSVGFRARYIKETAEMVSRGEVDLYNLKNIGYQDAVSELLKFPGVGPKVADCTALFSMGYSIAFPVDVWVKRIMQQFYLAPDVSLKKIQKYGQERFSELAGYAQQYLFYYIREMKGNI